MEKLRDDVEEVGFILVIMYYDVECYVKASIFDEVLKDIYAFCNTCLQSIQNIYIISGQPFDDRSYGRVSCLVG